MSEKNPVAEYIDEAVSAAGRLGWEKAVAITGVMQKVLEKGNKILVCGNGGSAADASHFAGELVGRFRKERRGFPAVALSSDPVVITAVGNDYGFETVFARQVEALGLPGDLLVVLSTSGTSRNVIRAASEASRKGMKVVAFTSSSAPDAEWADHQWRAVSGETSNAQEQMMITLHGICHGLEVLLAKGE